jgi:hypothetical protein
MSSTWILKLAYPSVSVVHARQMVTPLEKLSSKKHADRQIEVSLVTNRYQTSYDVTVSFDLNRVLTVKIEDRCLVPCSTRAPNGQE